MGETTETDVPLHYAQDKRKRTGRVNDYLVWQPSIFLSMLETIENIAPRDCPVIIHGEPGTTKEMVARQIHANSGRAQEPFVPTNCGTLTGTILESQLFGQVKNDSAAGTIGESLGAFRVADGGTIFLDEIHKLDMELQTKVLGVLQNSSVRPLNSAKSFPVNVRLICATDSDLRQMVQQGSFLSELYFRLNVAHLRLPPLRERTDDIIILAKYFLDIQAQLYNEPAKTLSPSAVKILKDYNWPGNVRELANVMERVFVMNSSSRIDVSDLPQEILTADIVPPKHHQFPPMDEVDKKLVIRALETTKGQKMAAAKLLKIDHRKLNRLIKKFSLQPSHFKND